MYVSIIVSELYDNCIPDYIFIAPFSKAGRISLQKKLFFYNIFARWIITSAFIMLPKPLSAAGSNILHNPVVDILEITVIYLLLFITGHLRYFYLINKINFTLTGIFTYFALPAFSFIFFLITEDMCNTSSYVLMAVMGILITVISLYYYRKHFKNMLEFYSGYELRTQAK